MIEDALWGALSQNGVGTEVIVVDDGSREAAPAALRTPASPRVRYLRHEHSTGPAAARNRGIAEARGEWVAFLDDDDVWAPEKLRLQLDAARAADAGFAYASAAHVERDFTPLQIERAPTPERLRELLRSYNAVPAGSSNVIARRDVLLELGGFDEAFSHLTDWDLWLRLAHRAAGAACRDVLVGYFKHPGNMLGLRSRDFFGELDRFAAKHRDGGAAAHLELDRVAIARWVAFTHRQAGRRMSAAHRYVHAMRFGKGQMNLGSALRALSESSPRRLPPPSPAAEPAWLESYRRRAGGRR